jgi:hypothetical protein
MDLKNYYTALPDTKTELAIFIKDGFFGYGSTMEENQTSQTHTRDGTSQDGQGATKFMLTNITLTVTKVRMFEARFVIRAADRCVMYILRVRGSG